MTPGNTFTLDISVSQTLKPLLVHLWKIVGGGGDFEDVIKYYTTHHPICYDDSSSWYDFGHLNSYFESRSRLTTERAFNKIEVKNGILWKTGNPQKKIEAEASWFMEIPEVLKLYTPQFLGIKEKNKKKWYGVEYLPFIPMNEIFVHGDWENENFSNVLAQILGILELFSEKCGIKISREKIEYIYIKKTNERLRKLKEEQPNVFKFFLDFLGKERLEDCFKKTMELQILSGVLHGDMCFSNILYSSRGERIKFIDPRGLDGEGNFSIYGDQKYDLAKILHSLVGMYDYIIAGKYKIFDGKIEFPISESLLSIQADFLKKEFHGLKMIDIMPVVVLLFISMLPLHSDREDRQYAFVLNARRIYDKYVK